MSLSENPSFGAMIGNQIANRNNTDIAISKSNTNQVIAEHKLSVITKELDEVTSAECNFIASIAGVRGVTRELLDALRRSDPKNPLLDKKNRDKVWQASYDKTSKQVAGKTFKERDERYGVWRDETFGAKNSTKSGPEYNEISSNSSILATAQVPEHTSDRENFMILIKKLALELHKSNPTSEILQDKAMTDVLETYALNEMIKQVDILPALKTARVFSK